MENVTFVNDTDPISPCYSDTACNVNDDPYEFLAKSCESWEGHRRNLDAILTYDDKDDELEHLLGPSGPLDDILRLYESFFHLTISFADGLSDMDWWRSFLMCHQYCFCLNSAYRAYLERTFDWDSDG